MTDQSVTTEFSKIILAAIRDENFTSAKRLPVADAFVEYVLPSQLARKISNILSLFSKMRM